MFDLLFPKWWSTLKKLIWLKAAALSSAVVKTVTAAIIHIKDALAGPAQNVTIAIEPVQAGSGDPSPDNVRPISGWTGANVTRTGKNLFDKTTAVFVAGGFSNGVIASYTNHFNTYLPCKPNTTYTISRKRTVDNERFAVAWCADTPAAGVAIFGAKSITNYGENIGETLSLTITTGATAKYLAIWAYWTATNITEAKNTLQVQVGSSVSSYESYTGTTIPISFGSAGTVYGGTLDVTTGVLTVDRAAKEFDGTEAWALISADTTARRYTMVLPESPYPDNTVLGQKGLVSHGVLYFSSAGAFGVFRLYTTGQFGAFDTNKHFADLDAFKSWLAAQKTAGTPLTAVWPIATPQTYQLTAQQIDLLLGENNLRADTGNTTLTYLADGRASDVEALGILLAGRYVNHGAADEATDAEALDILLGGTK